MNNEIIKEIEKIKKIEKERLHYVKCLLTEPQHLQTETVKQLEIEEYSLNKAIDIMDRILMRIKCKIGE